MITNKELAVLVGVSEATISLVLNGKRGISEKTRKNVIEKIRDLGYEDVLNSKSIEVEEKPVKDHLSLSKSIAFVLYKVGGELLGMNSFFPLIFDGIERTSRKYGCNLIVFTIDREETQDGISRIKEAGCSGVVIFATEMQEHDLEAFHSIGVPIVLFDNHFPGSDINSVKVNNEQGIYIAIRHLYELGHKKIGYLSSGLPINSFRERREWAKTILERFSLEFESKYYFEIGYPTEKAEKNIRELLSGKIELPTAFISDNDLVAIGAMQAFKKEGYRIPEDISIVGYDDRPICELVEPALTTIRLPREFFGAEAVERLARLMNDSDKCIEKQEINGKLIVRGSSSFVNL